MKVGNNDVNIQLWQIVRIKQNFWYTRNSTFQILVNSVNTKKKKFQCSFRKLIAECRFSPWNIAIALSSPYVESIFRGTNLCLQFCLHSPTAPLPVLTNLKNVPINGRTIGRADVGGKYLTDVIVFRPNQNGLKKDYLILYFIINETSLILEIVNIYLLLF